MGIPVRSSRTPGESATSLKECRVPSPCTRSASATTWAASSIDDGRTTRSAVYVTVPDQLSSLVVDRMAPTLPRSPAPGASRV
ncbi:hypothetical protein Q9Q99_07330 [Curtobacterium flaccumfaciens]|nr:hypothetical protein Q9Q99_07330 [Curtobacterium flaccumfaciens]